MKCIEITCPYCHKNNKINMTDDHYIRYTKGNELIQHIFPNLLPAIREILITGICPNCWNNIFANEED